MCLSRCPFTILPVLTTLVFFKPGLAVIPITWFLFFQPYADAPLFIRMSWCSSLTCSLAAVLEPFSSEAPKIAEFSRSNTFIRAVGSAFGVPCQAQGFPVPEFRSVSGSSSEGRGVGMGVGVGEGVGGEGWAWVWAVRWGGRGRRRGMGIGEGVGKSEGWAWVWALAKVRGRRRRGRRRLCKVGKWEETGGEIQWLKGGSTRPIIRLSERPFRYPDLGRAVGSLGKKVSASGRLAMMRKGGGGGGWGGRLDMGCFSVPI